MFIIYIILYIYVDILTCLSGFFLKMLQHIQVLGFKFTQNLKEPA